MKVGRRERGDGKTVLLECTEPLQISVWTHNTAPMWQMIANTEPEPFEEDYSQLDSNWTPLLLLLVYKGAFFLSFYSLRFSLFVFPITFQHLFSWPESICVSTHQVRWPSGIISVYFNLMYFPSEALNDAFVTDEIRICSIRSILKDLCLGVNRKSVSVQKVNMVDCQSVLVILPVLICQFFWCFLSFNMIKSAWNLNETIYMKIQGRIAMPCNWGSWYL